MASHHQPEREDPFRPSMQLLSKLASVAVHAEEYLSSDGHDLDRIALEMALADPQVTEWMAAMDKAALAPRKRKA